MTKSIINPANDIIGDPLVPLNIEADLIITCVILGFICTRYYQGQRCQFDFKHPSQKEFDFFQDLDTKTKDEIAKKIFESTDLEDNEKIAAAIEQIEDVIKHSAHDADNSSSYTKYLQEMQDFYLTLDALSVVIDKQEPGMGKWLHDGQSPFGKEGELITGKKGGEMVSPECRVTPFTLSKAEMLKNALDEVSKNTVYQGRGAYTGLIENPIDANTTLYPTMRVMPNAVERPWQGILGENNWGLIKAVYPKGSENIANLNTDPKIGMGPIPEAHINAQVGYIHGMCAAIISCIKEGVWCTPYEMATGEKTTKMASCFPCATFMYTTGYSPTSIHLGSGESWVPPQTGGRLEEGNDKPKDTMCNDELCKRTSSQWNLEIHQNLDLGAKCLMNASEFLNPDHKGKLSELIVRLNLDKAESIDNLVLNGGALFLDALTLHDRNVAERIQKTLAPVLNTLKFMTEHTAS